MRNYLLSFLIITAMSCASTALAQPYLFKQDYFGPTENSTGGTHCQTLDGGMILITPTIAGVSPIVHFTQIVKTSVNGSAQWSRRFINWYSEISNIVQTADSGYVFLYVAQGDPHAYSIVKLDASGNTIYTNRIILPGNYTAPVNLCCLAKSDGGIYIASHVRDAPLIYALCLTEVSPGGNAIWSKCYNDRINSNCKLDRCANGDILLSSSRTDTATGFTNPLITRVDSEGVFLWSKFYTFPSNVIAYTIHEFANGNINLITAIYNTATMLNETIYMETDPAGNLIRTVRYGNPTEQVRGITSLVVENTKLVVTGNGNTGFFYMKIDETGNVLSSSSFPNIIIFSIGEMSGPGYTFAGMESSLSHAILFSTDTSGTTCFSVPLAINTSQISFSVLSLSDTFSLAVSNSTFNLPDTVLPLISNKLCETMGSTEIAAHEVTTRVYPNPASDLITVQSPDVILKVEISDASGRLVLSSSRQPQTNEVSVTSLTTGCYIIHIFHENYIESQRLIIE